MVFQVLLHLVAVFLVAILARVVVWGLVAARLTRNRPSATRAPLYVAVVRVLFAFASVVLPRLCVEPPRVTAKPLPKRAKHV